MGQIFYPSSFHVIQPFLESVHYDLVNSLGLSISLGISGSGILACNSKVTIVSLERFAIKRKAIVQDEGTKDPKLGDNVFPNILLGIYISDIRQELSFNPLSK